MKASILGKEFWTHREGGGVAQNFGRVTKGEGKNVDASSREWGQKNLKHLERGAKMFGRIMKGVGAKKFGF